MVAPFPFHGENPMSIVVKHDIDIETAIPDAAKMRRYTPEKHVEKRFSDALAYLVFKWQLFAQLIYSGMEIAFTRDVPIAATDSHTIFLNPEGFEEHKIIDVLELVFVLAHEVGHRIRNHLVLAIVWRKTGQVICPDGTVLPYDHELMNMAEDYGINAMLVSAGLGRMPKCGLYDPNLSSAGFESCVEIYQKLWKKGKGPTGSGKKPGEPGGGFDLHMEPSDEQIKKDKGKREQEIVAAVQLAERTNPGSIPGAVARILEDIVNPKVPWSQHLRASMTRNAGLPKLDWRYLNRRLAGRDPSQYFAKIGHVGAGLIIIAGDCSGSIQQPQINTFAGEMTGIVSDLNPLELVILWCDAGITRTDRLDEPQDLVPLFADWKKVGVGGGGGTDFNPVFQWIEKQGLVPDMLVYFTDGEGTFPEREPSYPVIWASILERSRYPFGEVINVSV
jgi:predicted metal-dependent peptidase